MVVLWTGTILAGPFLVRTASTTASREGDAGALNLAVAGYVVVAVARLPRRTASRCVLISRIGEGVPARPAHPGVRPPAAAVDAVLRPREGRRARVAHDLRRRLAAGARADGPAHVRDATRCCSWSRSSCWRLVSWQLLLRLPHLRAVRGPGQHQVPARLEPGLPRRPRPHRHHAVARCRRASPASGSSRPSAARTSRSSASQHGNRALYDAHMRSVRISAWYLPVIEFAGLGTTALAVGVGGWLVHRGRRHHRHRRRSSCSRSPTCSSRCSSSASCSTWCSRPAPA